ncbi:MAG: pentapeptide repeat-containing protein, partial [Cyanobium sp.]
MKLSWGARVWKWGSWALLSVVLAALIANRGWIVDALKSRFPGKGLWDYLEILLVPVLIFGLGVLLDSRSKARDAIQKNEAERIRQEENRDQALQLYFDRVSSILLDKQVISLAEAAKKLGPEYKDPLVESARDVIRAQTLAILRVFSADEEKKSSVVLFLIESEILASLTVSLRGANLSEADLSEANLSGADLSGAGLIGADLSEANLSEANLSGADLFGANLFGANLCGADLSRANLFGANLIGAELRGADLKDASGLKIAADSEQRLKEVAAIILSGMGNL